MSQDEGGPTTPGLEDPALLAEIEAEFAELTAELERIHALPRALAPKKAELVKALREQWFAKQAARTDRPAWRAQMDDAIGVAIARILEDGIHETADGRLEFALANDSVQAHGGPILGALIEGFKQLLTEKLAKRPPAAPAGAPAAPPNPLQGLVVGLGQMLAQAIANTQGEMLKRQQRAQATAAAAPDVAPAGSAPSDAPTPGEAPAPNAVTIDADAGGLKVEVRPGTDALADKDVTQLHASVGFDTSKGDTLPPILPEMFQAFVSGLGKMLNDATRVPARPAPAPPASAVAPAATVAAPAAPVVPAAPAAPVAPPASVTAPVASTATGPAPAAPVAAPAAAPAAATAGHAPAIPASAVIDRALAALAAAPAAALRPGDAAPQHAAPPESTPRAASDAALQQPTPAAAAPPSAPEAAPQQAPLVAARPPIGGLKIDFQGLLGQLFKLAPQGLATPPVAAPAAAPAAPAAPTAPAVDPADPDDLPPGSDAGSDGAT